MPKTIAGRRPILLAALASMPAALLGGCQRMLTEMRTPAVTDAFPTEIVEPGPNALQTVVSNLAASFANRAEALNGHPRQTARAVGQLEIVYQLSINDPSFGQQIRFMLLGSALRETLKLARDEVREAIGIRPEAPARAVVDAMAGVIRALTANNRAGAAAALAPGLFNPGLVTTLQRLGRPGPMPTAEQATAQLYAEVQRMNLVGGWEGAPLGATADLDRGFTPSATPGLGNQF